MSQLICIINHWFCFKIRITKLPRRYIYSFLSLSFTLSLSFCLARSFVRESLRLEIDGSLCQHCSRCIIHQYETWLTLRHGQQVSRPFIGHFSDTRGRLTGVLYNTVHALHAPPVPTIRLSRLWPLIASVRSERIVGCFLSYQVDLCKLHLYYTYCVVPRTDVSWSANRNVGAAGVNISLCSRSYRSSETVSYEMWFN